MTKVRTTICLGDASENTNFPASASLMETIKAFGLQNRFPSPIQFSLPHSSAAIYEYEYEHLMNKPHS
jgi:hypothetical protein